MEETLDMILEQILTNYAGDDVVGLGALIEKVRSMATPPDTSAEEERYNKLKADYIARFFGRNIDSPSVVNIEERVEDKEDDIEDMVEEEDNEELEELKFTKED